MNLRILSYLAVTAAAACDGKLVVDRGATPANGSSNAAGSDAGMAEVSGGGGGTTIPPDAGKVGRPCIPGGVVTESEGNAAQAEIQIMVRCDAGLSCNAQGKCVPTPDCQTSSGACVLRQTEFMSNDQLPKIVAVSADDSHVYWLEYGTYDAGAGGGGPSRVYRHDGALLSYSLADRKTAILASGLDGPDQLALTTTHAYVVTYGGGADEYGLVLRVPLTGGSVQFVQQTGYKPPLSGSLFAAAGSQMFWTDRSGLYSMSSDAAATPTLFLSTDDEHAAYGPMSDGVDLFYVAGNGDSEPQLMRTPITRAAPVVIGLSKTDNFGLHDDGIFALTSAVARMDTTPAHGVVLLRAPKNGGEFEPVRSLGAGYRRSLQVVGDRYFYHVIDAEQDSQGNQINLLRFLTATFDDDAPPVRLLEFRDANNNFVRWSATAQGLYWTDGRALYQQPLPTQ